MECEIASFYSVDDRKARKSHRCCECSAPIVAGESYVYCLGKWAGDFQTYKQHTLCADACRHVRDQINDGECIGFGELKSFWSEYKRDCDTKRYDHARTLRSMLAKIFKRERAAPSSAAPQAAQAKP
jgi:hypothetical protein